MKRIILNFSVLVTSFFTNAQVVNIPDANFKNTLLAHNPVIDTNHDNEIQVSEASAFTGLMNLYNKGISDLTGIEAFVNMTTLYCYYNNLANVDISKNIALTQLRISNNKLASLDLSKNTAMQYLECNNNQITDLDLSKNIALKNLTCQTNLLTSLNLNANVNLKNLYCGGNPLLVTLDLKNGNNIIISDMWANNNPKLVCIQVDNVAYASANSSWLKDATATYNTNCALSVSEIGKKEMMLFPNPAKEVLNFSEEVSDVRITDVSGKVVKQGSSKGKSVNVGNLPKGIYILTGASNTKTINQKFIKE